MSAGCDPHIGWKDNLGCGEVRYMRPLHPNLPASQFAKGCLENGGRLRAAGGSQPPVYSGDHGFGRRVHAIP